MITGRMRTAQIGAGTGIDGVESMRQVSSVPPPCADRSTVPV